MFTACVERTVVCLLFVCALSLLLAVFCLKMWLCVGSCLVSNHMHILLTAVCCILSFACLWSSDFRVCVCFNTLMNSFYPQVLIN